MKATIFDYVGAILHTKDSSIFSNIDDEATFSPYMVNRWISMYSLEMNNLVNETTNKYYQIFNTKQDLFNFYVSVYPRLKQKRINYIKKPKAEKEKEEDEKIPLMAKYRECSIREIQIMENMVELLRERDQ